MTHVFAFRDRVKMAGRPIYTAQDGPRQGAVVYFAGKLDPINVRVRWSNGDASTVRASALELMTPDECAEWRVPTMYNRSAGDSTGDSTDAQRKSCYGSTHE